MDLSSASQCSSGCESGWTLYLDQSSYSKNQYYNPGGIVSKGNNEVEEEEEDLSMVSDASSGPRHYHCEEEDEYCFGGGDHHGNANNCFGSNDSASGMENKKSKSKMKNKEQQHGRSQVHHSYLDDTASSPVLGFSKNKNMGFSKNEAAMKNVFDFSQGFSATHLKKSSLSKKPVSGATGGFQGRKWE